ncbi:YpoC family protein [Staphylococcus caprae]
MIEKSDFEQLETQLDVYASQKKLKSQEAQPVIDDYFEMILNYFKQINEIDHINFDKLSEYPIVPMNFDERYHYMVARKYHFMGYRQMKTLKSELIKMNASYQIRKKRQNNK